MVKMNIFNLTSQKLNLQNRFRNKFGMTDSSKFGMTIILFLSLLIFSCKIDWNSSFKEVREDETYASLYFYSEKDTVDSETGAVTSSGGYFLETYEIGDVVSKSSLPENSNLNVKEYSNGKILAGWKFYRKTGETEESTEIPSSITVNDEGYVQSVSVSGVSYDFVAVWADMPEFKAYQSGVEVDAVTFVDGSYYYTAPTVNSDITGIWDYYLQAKLPLTVEKGVNYKITVKLKTSGSSLNALLEAKDDTTMNNGNQNFIEITEDKTYTITTGSSAFDWQNGVFNIAVGNLYDLYIEDFEMEETEDEQYFAVGKWTTFDNGYNSLIVTENSSSSVTLDFTKSEGVVSIGANLFLINSPIDVGKFYKISFNLTSNVALSSNEINIWAHGREGLYENAGSDRLVFDKDTAKKVTLYIPSFQAYEEDLQVPYVWITTKNPCTITLSDITVTESSISGAQSDNSALGLYYAGITDSSATWMTQDISNALTIPANSGQCYGQILLSTSDGWDSTENTITEFRKLGDVPSDLNVTVKPKDKDNDLNIYFENPFDYDINLTFGLDTSTYRITMNYTKVLAADEHSITYLDSDGTTVLSGMSPTTFKETEDVDLSSAVPTKTGYIFNGWSETLVADATSGTTGSTSYTAISGWSAGEKTSDVTLYAVWSPISYTIAFNKLSDDATGTMDDISAKYDESVTLTKNAFTRTGYTFAGWGTASSGSLAGYIDGQTVSNLTTTDGETVTLYAVWLENSYTIAFSGNATDITGTMDDISATYSEEVTLTENAYARTGYSFAGWVLSSSTTTAADYDDKATVSKLSATSGDVVTLYALWLDNSYTIVFDKNADDATGSMSSVAVTYSEEVTLTENIFTRSGYTFLGWALSETATSADYEDKTTVSKLTSKDDGTVTLYAVWQKNSSSGGSTTNPFDNSTTFSATVSGSSSIESLSYGTENTITITATATSGKAITWVTYVVQTSSGTSITDTTYVSTSVTNRTEVSSGSSTATCTVTFTSSMPPGTYYINVSASVESVTYSDTITATVVK